MSYKVAYLDESKQDMKDIAVYLSQYYPNTARRFSEKVKKQILLLKNMPYMHPAYESDSFFRRMIVGDYLLFYSVNEERRLVIIHRIIHCSRNVSLHILEKSRTGG